MTHLEIVLAALLYISAGLHVARFNDRITFSCVLLWPAMIVVVLVGDALTRIARRR